MTLTKYTVPAGTIVRLNGVALRLTSDTEIETHPNNWLAVTEPMDVKAIEALKADQTADLLGLRKDASYWQGYNDGNIAKPPQPPRDFLGNEIKSKGL